MTTPGRLILRRKLILWSIVPALLLLGIAAKLITMVAYGYQARSDYLAYDAGAVADDVRKLKTLNVIDSYKAYLAEGDRYMLEGRLGDAEAEFRTALSLVDQDESCPVRVNLTVVLTALGDLKDSDGRREEAQPYRDEALSVMRQAPQGCFDPADEQALQDKQNEPSAGGGQGGGGGEQGGGGGQGGADQGDHHPDPGQPPPDAVPPAPEPGGAPDPGDGQGQGGDPAQAPTGVPEGQAPDDVGADRIATDSGPAIHELRPQDGEPDEVLERLLEDAGASGVDRE